MRMVLDEVRPPTQKPLFLQSLPRRLSLCLRVSVVRSSLPRAVSVLPEAAARPGPEGGEDRPSTLGGHGHGQDHAGQAEKLPAGGQGEEAHHRVQSDQAADNSGVTI